MTLPAQFLDSEEQYRLHIMKAPIAMPVAWKIDPLVSQEGSSYVRDVEQWCESHPFREIELRFDPIFDKRTIEYKTYNWASNVIEKVHNFQVKTVAKVAKYAAALVYSFQRSAIDHSQLIRLMRHFLINATIVIKHRPVPMSTYKALFKSSLKCLEKLMKKPKIFRQLGCYEKTIARMTELLESKNLSF